MPEIGTSGSMAMGNGALPNGPSYRAHPRLYRSDVRPTASKAGAVPISHS